ncbi:sugar transferase [Xanthomarina sp.]|uniref:sugar transferase n=1 Tax=Xanthomarina sp. TaxID=1931211 RepID=UPI002CFC427C|nr:sugar transferase [Xanthomarina sp.]HLV38035.1 sugar transferase [Xanthomarina sp.]
MYRHIKRVFDILFSFLLILVTLPIMVVLLVYLKIHFKSNPIFKQKRLGYKNQEFFIYKLKTMKDLFDEAGNPLPDKLRITEQGALIRKLSLDEIPQVFNILKGDMSFIGPRPLSIKNLPFYTERELKRHNVKPGISGWAQINGRNSLDWDKRLEMDVFYVENLSVGLDIKIFFKTIQNVLYRKDIAITPQIPSLIKTRSKNHKTVND